MLPELRYTILAYILIALHALYVFVLPEIGVTSWPVSRAWGFGLLKLFPIYAVAAYLLCILVSIPSINRTIQKSASKILSQIGGRDLSTSWLVAIGLATLPIFWFIRQKYAIFGDGYAWIDGLAAAGTALGDGTLIPWKGYKQILGIISIEFALDPVTVVQATSCLLGIPFVLCSGLFAREACDNGWARWAVFGLLVSSGVSMLYFGYGETYAPIPVFVLCFAYLGIRSLRGCTSVVSPIVMVLIGFGVHSLLLCTVPAAIFLCISKLSSKARRKLLLPIVGLSAIGLAFLIYLALANQPAHELVFYPLFSTDAREYAFFTTWHWWERLNGLMLLSPLFLALVISLSPPILTRLRDGDTVTRFLVILAAPFALSNVFTNFVFGALDFDLLLTTAFPMLLAVVPALGFIREGSARYLAVVAVVVSFLNIAPWVVANATDRTFQVMRTLMDEDPIHYWQGHQWSVRLAAFASRAERPDVAIQALEEGHAQKPDSYRISFNLGGRYWRAGRYDDALPLLVQALEADPLYVRAFTLIFQTYAVTDQEAGARKFYSEYLTTLFHRAQEALVAGNPARAAEVHAAILEMGENTAEVYQHLGANLQVNGETDLAREIYQKGIKLYPRNEALLSNLKSLDE
jgi:tetratricopeptide (TPR) repeat protein